MGKPLANSDGSSGSDSNGVKYDQLLGWVYFTDTPWVYSYTNGSWYYMHSTSEVYMFGMQIYKQWMDKATRLLIFTFNFQRNRCKWL